MTADLSLSLDPGYDPARVVLDSVNWDGTGDAIPWYDVAIGETVVAELPLNANNAPLSLVAGDYEVSTFQANGDKVIDGPTCATQFVVRANDDVAYYADYSAGNGCAWKEGSAFP